MTLMDVYAKTSRLELVLQVLGEMPSRNVVSRTMLAASLVSFYTTSSKCITNLALRQVCVSSDAYWIYPRFLKIRDLTPPIFNRIGEDRDKS
jgi:pentatricopeptide repeat protein|uniref:Pentatricopeptide repeat-containing protein n=1 Tax=Zea mays TaxID=4577 RepID=B6SWE1_MAIZE|nr:hypothetical protein [Zea mays]